MSEKNTHYEDIQHLIEDKKGFWEYVDDVDYRCSVCHKYAYGCLGEVLSGQYKYCPYCGARMVYVDDEKGTYNERKTDNATI